MKLLIFSIALMSGTIAHAHVEPGLYRGATPEGKPCEMRAVEMSFEGGVHHPLTERVVIDYGGEIFRVGHPSSVVRESAQVTFNHDLFQGINPDSNGAKAFVIEMIHGQRFEGPGAFEIIHHNWRTKTSSKLRCGNIKKI